MHKWYNKVALVAGKSGGHIVPGLVVAADIRSYNPECAVTFFSTRGALDSMILSKAQITHVVPLDFAQIRLTWYRLPITVIYAAKSFVTSFLHLRRMRPDAVISMGGAVSIPVCLAARLLRIPIILYELNVIPGQANMFLSRYAQQINVCFDHVVGLPADKVIRVEYPLRFSHSIMEKAAARQQLDIAPDAEVLLVLGGSQGSQSLNTFAEMYSAHRAQSANHLTVLHQAGAADVARLTSAYAHLGIPAKVFAYAADIEKYYIAADRVLARAGAGTLFELLFFDKKSIIIPLETRSTDHQVANAYAMAHRYPHLFTVLKQSVAEQQPSYLFQLLST